jgi:hypothetical protein
MDTSAAETDIVNHCGLPAGMICKLSLASPISSFNIWLSVPAQQNIRKMEAQESALAASARKKPWAVKFRASVGFCTAVVFLSLFCDLLVYSVIIPSKWSILGLVPPLLILAA